MSKPQLLSNDTDTFVGVRDRSVGILTSHQRQVNFASTSMSVIIGIRQLPIDNDAMTYESVENRLSQNCRKWEIAVNTKL
jgi:hypothetical protein